MLTARQANESSADNAAMLPIIQKCTHCGEGCNKGNKYCNECTYIAKRREMCAFNKTLMPNYICTSCQVF